MTEKTVPPLPCGSVDLDALHAADAKAGSDLAEAVANAIVAPAAAAETPSPAKAKRPAAKADDTLSPAPAD